MAMIVAAPVIRNEPKGPLSPDIGATAANALPLIRLPNPGIASVRIETYTN
jgi:hypothetical protein